MRTAVARKEVVEMAAPSMQVTRYPARPSRYEERGPDPWRRDTALTSL